MKYIVYKNSEVLHILDKAPISVSKGLGVARCEFIPKYNQAHGEYLEVFNVQEHTETYTEKEPKEVKKVDEQGNEYPDTEYIEVVKTRPYKTCELTVKQDESILKANRLRFLKSWFNNEYRYYNEKLTRFKALSISEIVIDSTFNIVYSNLDALYIQAEKVRAEINELEAILQ